MVEIEVGARYLCRDGYTRRVGRIWGDGTITWVMDPPPVIAEEIAGTCTPEAFVAMAASGGKEVA